MVGTQETGSTNNRLGLMAFQYMFLSGWEILREILRRLALLEPQRVKGKYLTLIQELLGLQELQELQELLGRFRVLLVM